MAKRVAVIILNWNGEKLLREFLPSVVKNTNTDLGRVVVVDNHSTDGSWICLEQEFPDVERVLFEDNFGFAGGYNRAIEMIEAEYVVLLNSDVEVAPGWLEPLVAVLDRDERVAAVQPKILAYRDKKKFEYAGAAWRNPKRSTKPPSRRVAAPFCKAAWRIWCLRTTGSMR